MRKILSFAFCLILLSQPVLANSAMTYWVGVDAQGVVARDSDCPIVVEHEELVLDIQELPSLNYDTTEEFLAYSPTATAKYRFYNPSDYSVTAKLVFPFGFVPDYSYSSGLAVDGRKYGAYLNGEPVETSLRCTLELPYSNSEFDVQEELPRLVDGYRPHEFYSPDLPVTRYVFEAKGVNFDDYKPVGRITVPVDPETTRYMFSYGYFQNGMRRIEHGETFIQKDVWLEPGYTTELYIIGKQTELPQWQIFDGSKGNDTPIDGTVQLLETEIMTLEDLIFTYYPEDSGIVRSDWYNAVLDDLDRNAMDNGHANSSFLFGGNAIKDYHYYLLNWYEYEITLEPGQRVENTVVVPFYPDIDDRYEPAVYNYTYLLSPASTWADFGSLDIKVQTPYYIVGESSIELTTTVDGYAASLDGLPEGELEFTLCSVSEPAAPKKDYFSWLRQPLMLLIFALVHYGWLILLILLGWYIYRKLRKDQEN